MAQGFKKLRLFPITSRVSEDGYPAYGAVLKVQALIDETDIELNSVEISLEDVVNSTVRKADDKEVETKVITRYTGTLKVFDVDKSALKSMFGFTEDANGNLLELANSTKNSFGVFFEGKNSKGQVFQKYLYDVTFDVPSMTFTTDDGSTTDTMEISFNGAFLTLTDGRSLKAMTVYSGNTGFVSGEPSTMYEEVLPTPPQGE